MMLDPAREALFPLGDDHVVKFTGKSAPEAAKAFFDLELSLPRGEYLVRLKNNKLYLYGIKTPLVVFQVAGASRQTEFDGGVAISNHPGKLPLVVNREPTAEPEDAFQLVRLLLPVAKQVQRYNELKNGSKPASLAEHDELLEQILQMYGGISARDIDATGINSLAKARSPQECQVLRQLIKNAQSVAEGFPKPSRE